MILDVVPPELDDETEKRDADDDGKRKTSSKWSNGSIVRKLLDELQFEGMVGSQNEPLPRLQNLQADLPRDDNDGHDRGPRPRNNKNSIIVPIYRYPGNYSGTEWPTHPWSHTTLAIKRSVERALRPLYVQRMNHCVSNLYQNGVDRIDRHSDKDLDLNREGVIVSVSLGSSKVMEVRDRREPYAPGSMFVLGPYTNARFTHAVLPLICEEEGGEDGRENRTASSDEGGERTSGEDDVRCSVEDGGRISLTFRDVRTFLDVRTKRLFGQGVSSSMGTSLVIEDGVISEESLREAAYVARDDYIRERNGAIAIVLGINAVIAGYYASYKTTSPGREGGTVRSDRSTADLLRTSALSAMNAAGMYWCLRRARDTMRRKWEEKEARNFFSKKSASGNRY
mmetsp:Transcript_29009/g.69954  ORF Transcript_29009/g.69954 Transcript_29009/m.69954 type:complete len:396 (-) Transcript_29009:906-2093(-)